MNELPFHWAVFDLGNVVLTGTQATDRLAELLGAGHDDVLAAYYAHRPDYDQHSDAGDYWRRVAGSAGARDPADETIAELVRIDDNGWSTTDPDTLRLADDLRALGLRLAVLSKAPSSMGRLVEAADWSGVFDHLVFSGDHGVIKPAAAVFSLLLERLGTESGRAVLLDDRADNVEGARAAGLAAVQFRTATQARSELRTLGVPV